MSLSTLINRSCTVVRRSESGSTDDYGNDIPGTVEVETICEIQQRQREEPTGHGDLSETEWLGVFPAGTELDSGDAVVLDDLGRFEVDGAPWPARNPRTQAESHVEATLKQVAGPEDAS